MCCLCKPRGHCYKHKYGIAPRNLRNIVNFRCLPGFASTTKFEISFINTTKIEMTVQKDECIRAHSELRKQFDSKQQIQ